MQFIDLKTQYKRIEKQVDKRIKTVLEHGQYIMGPEVFELEEQLAAFVNVKHCISVANGTDALLIAMLACGIKAGDEVITTPFTFFAIGEMIALLGAKPVFVDINKRTFNLEPELIEKAITSKTKAIIPVCLFGQCADFDAINAIAEKYKISVIEDAAQSFGATYKGKKSGSLGLIGTTSFFPSKPLGCYGEGGACFTNSDELAAIMREIRLHGQDRRYHHIRLGINGRLETLQAAILLEKLKIFPDEILARQQKAEHYTHLLAQIVETPFISPENTSVFAQYTIQINERDSVQEKLKQFNIPTAVHYPIPLNLQPVFSYLNQGKNSFPYAEAVAERVLSLPFDAYLTEENMHFIADKLAACCMQMETIA